MQSIVSNRGLSASHLNPAVDSAAACSSAAGQHRPGQHSAPARSPEIRQSPTSTAGILCQTRGDRLQEIFWRVAMCSPECDFCRLLLRRLRGRDRSFGQTPSATKGERGKTLLFAAHRGVMRVRHGRQTPGADRQLFPSCSRSFARIGGKEATIAGAGGVVPALLSAKYYCTSGLGTPQSNTGIFNLFSTP